MHPGNESPSEKMVIHTPMDGIIDEVHAYKGDLISRGHSIASLISKEREVRPS